MEEGKLILACRIVEAVLLCFSWFFIFFGPYGSGFDPIWQWCDGGCGARNGFQIFFALLILFLAVASVCHAIFRWKKKTDKLKMQMILCGVMFCIIVFISFLQFFYYGNILSIDAFDYVGYGGGYGGFYGVGSFTFICAPILGLDFMLMKLRN